MPMEKNKMRTKSIVPKCVQTAYSRDFTSFWIGAVKVALENPVTHPSRQ